MLGIGGMRKSGFCESRWSDGDEPVVMDWNLLCFDG